MLFEAVAAGELHRYLVSLFVKDKFFSRTISVVEFVGRGEAFTEKLEAVRSAIRTLSF